MYMGPYKMSTYYSDEIKRVNPSSSAGTVIRTTLYRQDHVIPLVYRAASE